MAPIEETVCELDHKLRFSQTRDYSQLLRSNSATSPRTITKKKAAGQGKPAALGQGRGRKLESSGRG
ncbi:MAG: hypothetical protein CMB79_24060 [Filomicrobium sp.]|nr:hypothetical protein [Filomicrobium sp.]